MPQLILLFTVFLLLISGQRGSLSPYLDLVIPVGVRESWMIVLGTYGTIASVGSLCHAVCWFCRRRVATSGSVRASSMAWMSIAMSRWIALAAFAFWVMIGGFLDAVRIVLGGDLVLLDELVAVLPMVLMIVWGWIALAPVNRAVNEPMLLRKIREGSTARPRHSVAAFVIEQCRVQLLVVLVPLGLITLWSEAVRAVLGAHYSKPWLISIEILGWIVLMLCMPVLLRYIWSTSRLPTGPLRFRLLRMCHLHRLRVLDVLLWRTSTRMANGAVVGFLGPMRYVLLTDGLLETLKVDEVEAVMAHELGHVRYRHVPWMIASVMGVLLVSWSSLTFVADRVFVDREATDAAVGVDVIPLENGVGSDAILLTLLEAVESVTSDLHTLAKEAEDEQRRADQEQVAGLIGLGGSLLVVILSFGFVSRCFERQADAFSARHLSLYEPLPGDAESKAEPDDEDDAIAEEAGAATSAGKPRITNRASHTMSTALERVANQNAYDANRWTFRHGSIQERRAHLASLVGRRVDDLPIDRTSRAMKACSALLFVSGIVLVFVGL